MDITYTWMYTGFETESEGDLEKVVKMVHWKVFGISNTVVSDSLGGTVVLDSPDTDSFIKFDDLTVDNVKEWVESKVDVSNLNLEIEAILTQKLSPTNRTLVNPWISSSPPLL